MATLVIGADAFSASPDFKRVAMPFMGKYCYECHGGKKTKGDLDLKQFKDDGKIYENRKVWLGVLKQTASGEMPPKKHPTRPTPDEIAKFDDAINTSLDRAEAGTKPDPGRVTTRRLNRNEYNNTVRDLLGVDFNAAENFPADDIGYGFDNIGDVLTLSPVHLERYLAAAETVAAHAVPAELPKPPTRTTYSIFLEPGNYRSENGTRPVTNSTPELFNRQTIKFASDYTFQVRAAAATPTNAEPVRMTLLLDDRELKTFTVTNRVKRWQIFEVKLDSLSVGEHRFAARFANRTEDSTNRMLYINEFKVVGPADTRTDFQRQIAALTTGKPQAEQTRTLAEWFVTRAFRRPATKEELARYEKIVEAAQAEAGGKFELGAQQLIKVVLCSPKFLFRIEADDLPRAREPHPINDYQLAARLSYFLWSSMPDEELSALAAKKQLGKNLDEQVRRMLTDPKADALVENFAMQWLQLQRLQTFAPDRTIFPSFDDRLRRAMAKETELFVGEIFHEDRSILELVDADFTYLNEALAQHYGIADTAGNRLYQKKTIQGGQPIRGPKFVRVSLPMRERGGLVAQASVLTVTSNPTRTSPVKRGKWVLEQILGTPPPPPPTGVSPLDEQKELKGTLRQKMEQHRKDPNCASCHESMDSLGFGLENYDAIGRFRTKDGEGQIDPSGLTPDGRKFAGPAELKALLKDSRTLVARNLTEKLLTYALGRGLEYYDERAIKRIVADLPKSDYKFSALVSGIVKSEPFLLRRGTELNNKELSAR